MADRRTDYVHVPLNADELTPQAQASLAKIRAQASRVQPRNQIIERVARAKDTPLAAAQLKSRRVAAVAKGK